jgi:hypothetical protein
MVTRDGDSESDRIAASQAAVAYTMRHGQSFRANDCAKRRVSCNY